MDSIGFIGLGHMGLPMALNLVEAGYKVYGFDRLKAPCQTLQEAGGIAGESLAQVAQQCQVLITMLQTGEQVSQVTDGPEGLFAHARAGSLHIDCSTIDVNTARSIHNKAQKSRLSSLDAPVSGGVAGAGAATLTFMVGGEEAIFEHAKVYLSSMGKTMVHAGSAGSGQAAKICNNMILGISMIAISEAFVLADKLGLAASKLHEVVSSASGRCWAMDNYVPVPDVLANVPANNAYTPGFTAAMMRKDLRLGIHSAAQAALKLPMAEKARQIYEDFVDADNGEIDFSAIIKTLNEQEDRHA